MKTSKLLESLLIIAKTSKTDFAIYMNISPSGLSKILSGNRLPSIKEKRNFSRRSAHYFAESIYRRHCYLDFTEVFPVIYNFDSVSELELFLTHALDYALEMDYAEENDENLDYRDRELSAYLGSKSILNMICVLASDYVVNSKNQHLEVYNAIPTCSLLFDEIFNHLKFTPTKKQHHITFNHLFDMQVFENSYHLYDHDYINMMVQAQSVFHFNFWNIQQEDLTLFFLLKDHFLITFQIQIDKTPTMTFITHKGYLNTFYATLMSKKSLKQLSFSQAEVAEILRQNPDFLLSYPTNPIERVYSFLPVGYMTEERDLIGTDYDTPEVRVLLRFFQSILKKETSFYMTLDVIREFFSKGNLIIPLAGTMDIPPEARIPYLLRSNHYASEDQHGVLSFLDGKLSRFAAVSASGLTLIYLMDDEYNEAKFHVFYTDIFNDALKEMTSKASVQTFVSIPDLRDTFLNELAKEVGLQMY